VERLDQDTRSTSVHFRAQKLSRTELQLFPPQLLQEGDHYGNYPISDGQFNVIPLRLFKPGAGALVPDLSAPTVFTRF
jgi:hypothetical protein